MGKNKEEEGNAERKEEKPKKAGIAGKGRSNYFSGLKSQPDMNSSQFGVIA